MTNAILNLFRKKSSRKALTIIDIPYSKVAEHKNLLEQIFDEKIDGAIIRNYLNGEEVRLLLENYEKVPLEQQSCTGNGIYTFPDSFTSINEKLVSNGNTEETYAQTNAFWNQFEQQFGIDYIGKLKALFSTISSWEKIESPRDKNGKTGLYNLSTFRSLYPNGGQLKLHCGRFFHLHFPLFYEHLKTISDVHNQLSYFVTLRPSEELGQLKVFNIKWEEAWEKAGEMELKKEDGLLVNLDDPKQIEGITLDLNKGDLLIFKGSNIWHQVQEVKGGHSRITIGSFISRSKEEKALHLWS